PGNPIDPACTDCVITSAASLFGLGLGFFWLSAQGGFSAKGTFGIRLLRFAVGLIGVLVFWMGLGAVFPRDPDLISYTLRFIRYTLTTSWISGFAPWLFIKWGWADSAST
ncbi:MAG: hypothetical protein N2D54_02300, partial [Chloroflexota bacterium]